MPKSILHDNDVIKTAEARFDTELAQYNKLRRQYQNLVTNLAKNEYQSDAMTQGTKDLFLLQEQMDQQLDKVHSVVSMLTSVYAPEYPNDKLLSHLTRIEDAVNSPLETPAIKTPDIGIKPPMQIVRYSSYNPIEYETRYQSPTQGEYELNQPTASSSNMIIGSDAFVERRVKTINDIDGLNLVANENPSARWYQNANNRPALDSIQEKLSAGSRRLVGEIQTAQRWRGFASHVSFTHKNPDKDTFLNAAKAYLETPSAETFKTYQESRNKLSTVTSTSDSSTLKLAAQLDKHIALVERYDARRINPANTNQPSNRNDGFRP